MRRLAASLFGRHPFRTEILSIFMDRELVNRRS